MRIPKIEDGAGRWLSKAEVLALLGDILKTETPSPRLLSKAEVLALLGIKYTTLWTWMCKGQFPRALELGPPGGRSTTIAWRADEVCEWINARPRRKLGHAEREGAHPASQPSRARAARRRRAQERG